MAFKLTKANYKALRKMNMTQRMTMLKEETGMGRWLLSLLTPSQLVELFPLYYRKTALPDISGFSKAMPTSMTMAKQRAIEEQLANTASGARAGANMKAGGWRESWQEDMSRAQSARVSKNRPPPQLTPEQQETFNTLKSTPLAVDDPRAKMFANLSDDQLTQVGVKKTVTDGKSFYSYTAPTVSDDEVKRSIRSIGDTGSAEGRPSANQLYNYLKSKGASPNEATMLTAAAKAESSFNPNLSHDGGAGWGMWGHNIRERIDLRGMNWQQQASAALNELHTSNSDAGVKRAREMLRSAKSAEEIAQAQMHFERPMNYRKETPWTGHNYAFRLNATKEYMNLGDRESDPITQDYSEKNMQLAREKLIRQIETKRIGSLAEFTNAGLPTPGSPEASQFIGTSKNAQEVADRIRSQFNNLDNPQCVALAKAYVGATGSVKDWRRGNNVMDGTLQPGTPIATFMNRDGSPSTLYDGGGTGAPGNHTTHAAIFLDYQRDGAGKITGIRVMEQYKGSNGAKEKVYPIGGFRTNNGANYYSVNDVRTGRPLGVSNPMTLQEQQDTATVSAKPSKKPTGNLSEFTSSRKSVEQPAPKPVEKKEETKLSEQHTEKRRADVTVERDGKRVDLSPENQKKVDMADKVKQAMENPPKVDNKAPTQVKSNADGGVNKINTEEISAYPINGLRGDNAVVVNAQQKPLFTMNTDEKMLVDPKSDTAQVIPEKNEQQTDTRAMFDEFKAAIEGLRQEFSRNNPGNTQVQNTPNRFDHVDGSVINALNDISRNWYQTPSMQRAAYRAGGMETGEPTSNFHYSRGNRS